MRWGADMWYGRGGEGRVGEGKGNGLLVWVRLGFGWVVGGRGEEGSEWLVGRLVWKIGDGDGDGDVVLSRFLGIGLCMSFA